ncbi:MAG: lysophospholipid acyltransferase family protein [Bacteroidales bacterium]|jgi:predicted LPLAT superfamily acyltransferase|nr:lysophospholipid acyltransferase family protein [Bacteroidales bacterium]
MTSQNNHWKGKTQGGKFGQNFLIFIFKIIPTFFIYPFLYIIIPFYMLFDKKGYNAIFNYFNKQQNFSKFKSFLNTYMNFVVFGEIVLDKFAMLSNNAKQFKINIIGENIIKEYFEKNQGFIICSAHVGNFEMAGFAFNRYEKNINSLFFHGETENYQKQRSKAHDAVKINSIFIKEDMSHIFTIKKLLETGEIITVLCDRNFGSNKKSKVNFFNGEAFFPQGTFRLAIQLNVPMVALFIMKKNFRKYEAHIVPINIPNNIISPIEETNLFLNNFAKELENILKKYPRQWFNFYDFWTEK